VHFGYNETAMAMLRESALEEKALSQKNGESMQQRKRIRDAVLAGEIDEAIEQTNLIAPELFMSQPSVLFELKCQKFVEMVRNGDDEATMAYGRTELCDFETESEDNKLHLQVNDLVLNVMNTLSTFSMVVVKQSSTFPRSSYHSPWCFLALIKNLLSSYQEKVSYSILCSNNQMSLAFSGTGGVLLAGISTSRKLSTGVFV
jgi:hypothetical protein